MTTTPNWLVCRVGALAIATALLVAGRSFATEPAPEDPIIQLPKFVVTDSRVLPPPESWRYGSIPGFEILSNASDRATQRLVRDFEMFRTALGVVWPLAASSEKPILLVVCGAKRKFEEFAPEDANRPVSSWSASRLFEDQRNTAIVIDAETSVIYVTPSDEQGLFVDHNELLYREYVRHLLSRAEPRLPAWFEEGMAQLVRGMKFDTNYIEFARLEDPNARWLPAGAAELAASIGGAGAVDAVRPPDEDRDFNAILSGQKLMPMDRFLAVEHDSPLAANPLGRNRWAKQAYAFVHMGLYGDRNKWQRPFLEFVMRSTREPVTEELFKQCFKMSYDDMLWQLRGYVGWSQFRWQEYRIKGDGIPRPADLALRDATDAEVGWIKGETLRLAGRPEAAMNQLIAAYVRGGRDPRLLAELGFSEHAAGKHERAHKFLAAAVAGKVQDPDAHLTLARLRIAEAEAAPGAENGRFSASQMAGIVPLLLTARELPPRTPESYELLAKAFVHSPVKLTYADIKPLVEGAQYFPTRMKLVYASAVLCAEAGLLDTAHPLVEHGIRHAATDTTRAQFKALRATLPPLAK